MTKSAFALSMIFFSSLGFAATPPLQTRLVASGLTQPLFAGSPVGDDRLFIVERGGLIKILENGTVRPTPFLDLSGSVDTSGERGLLGMAFDPGFRTNGRVYVNYIDKATLDTVVKTYQVSAGQPNIADISTGQTVLTVDQPEGSVYHKAGWVGFRPGEAANLYVATGDGVPSTNGQRLDTNLGKILRIDVSEDRFPNDDEQYGYAIPAGNLQGGNPEIYAYGLRNPYRNSFDRENGTFYIADVGSETREEINIGEAGANYGWHAYEGTVEGPFVTSPEELQIANHHLPIYEYDHNDGPAAVIGGYVYRGSAIDDLPGTYFFADLSTNKVTSFRFTEEGGVTELTDRTEELISPDGITGNITSFGEDGFGNLYLISFNGEVGLITAVPEPEAWAMMLAGITLIGAWARRRKNGVTLRAVL